MKNLGGKLIFIISVVLFITALTLVGVRAPAPAAAAAKPGIPPGAKIHIGTTIDVSGPLQATETPIAHGVVDCFDYINKVDGGVRGVPIHLSWRDDGYSVANAIAGFKNMKRQDTAVWLSFNSGAGEAMKQMLARAKIPLLTLSASPGQIRPPGWIYFAGPPYPDEFAGVCKWIAENWKKKRRPVIGMITYDNPFGRGPERARTFVEKEYGVKILDSQYLAWVPVDTTPALLYVKKNNADFVWSNMCLETEGPMLKDAKRMGLTDKIQFIEYRAMWSRGIVPVAGDACEGLIGPSCYAETFDDVPEIARLKDAMKRFRGWDELKEHGGYLWGWFMAQVAAKYCGIAIDKYGWPLNGEKVKKAFDTTGKVDMGGMVPYFTFNPEDPDERVGNYWERLYQIRNGKSGPITDWYECPRTGK